jgi:hypothetical protein
VGEPDRPVLPERAGRGSPGEVEQGGGNAGRQGAQGQVGEAFLEPGDLFAEDPGNADGDPGVRDQEPFHLPDPQLADRRVLDCFGVVVVHPLAHQQRLAEDGSRFEDGHGQRLAVLGDPEDTHPFRS